jgi:hypothetical protein
LQTPPKTPPDGWSWPAACTPSWSRACRHPVWFGPSQKSGGVALGFEALAECAAAESVASVVGMMALADQNTDGAVDDGQL